MILFNFETIYEHSILSLACKLLTCPVWYIMLLAGFGLKDIRRRLTAKYAPLCARRVARFNLLNHLTALSGIIEIMSIVFPLANPATFLSALKSTCNFNYAQFSACSSPFECGSSPGLRDPEVSGPGAPGAWGRHGGVTPW